MRQGGLTRAASFLSRLFALLLLPRAGAGSVGKRRVSAGKAAAECWCRAALGCAAAGELCLRHSKQPARQLGLSVSWKTKQIYFLVSTQKEKSVDMWWGKVVR